MADARGKVVRMAWITRGFVRANPDMVFCFGDNMARRGFGGQAREMRGEPNAVGVPTKWTPSTDPDAYFRDADLGNPSVAAAIDGAFLAMAEALDGGRDVVVPADGVGTGLGKLAEKAPAIHRHIEACFAALEASSG